MRKATAAAGSLAHLVLQPGIVAGLVPWWLTGWKLRNPAPSWAWTPLRVAGLALVTAGVLVLVHAFVRFVVEGVGTPAPIAPTQQLVVGGPYRYVRNPMYLAVTATIVGQALALGQPVLLGYAAAVGAAMVAFVHGYEEPTLRGQFGAHYEAYRHAVPAWWPRRHPWQPGQATRLCNPARADLPHHQTTPATASGLPAGPWDAVSRQSHGTASEAFPGDNPMSQEGRAISITSYG